MFMITHVWPDCSCSTVTVVTTISLVASNNAVVSRGSDCYRKLHPCGVTDGFG